MDTDAPGRAPLTPLDHVKKWCDDAIRNGGRVMGDKRTRATLTGDSIEDLWEIYSLYRERRRIEPVARADFEAAVAEKR
jgi:hypothetical protein